MNLKSLMLYLTILVSFVLIVSCGKEKVEMEIHRDIGDMLARFAPVEITTDISFLPENEQRALAKLIEASKYMDEIFLRQVWVKNPEYKRALADRYDTMGIQAYKYFNIMTGIWDRLSEDDMPFINAIKKPEGAGFYPEDMTKEEFESYLQAHPDLADTLKSEYTIVQRSKGKFVAVPYSQAYKKWLVPAAALLREAAELTENASLRTFLISRADAFISNKYRQSDMDWMDLDSPVEITIGPYEVYEDKLFGYKTSFESFVTVTDPAESKKLTRFKSELPNMERNLPIPNRMKNLNRGSESPIRVVDEVFTGGDTKAGVQTIAYNLPNDEVVRELKGSKKVLLRNVITAKYEKILKPIAETLLNDEQLKYLTADAFTNEVLFHELSHGLGPGKITLNGRQTEVRLELKDLYSASEEAKADIMGVYNILYMIKKGLFPRTFRKEIAVTYLAGLFRGIRFGIGEAHGKGAALQFNYLLGKGVISYNQATGKYAVNQKKFDDGVSALVHDICVYQANGDYSGMQTFLQTYVKLPEQLQDSLKKLETIPVDIVPSYPLAEQLFKRFH